MENDKNKRSLNELLEDRFGKNFTASITDIKNFILDLIDNGYSMDKVYNSLLAMYRDDFIDYYCLKDILDALGLELVNEFSFYSEKAKTIIRKIAPKVSCKEELVNYLYNYYYNNLIEYKVFEVACLLMGYSFSKEFTKMNDDDRRNSFWTYDKNDKPVILKDASADLFKQMNSFKYTDDRDLLYPKIMYRYPLDFAFDYMDQNGIDDKVLVNAGLDRRKKYKIAHRYTLKKIEVFRFIFILKMPVTIAKQFLTLAGYCFSPLIKEDLFFLDYLNGKFGKVETLEELDELAYDNDVYEGKEREKKHFQFAYWK